MAVRSCTGPQGQPGYQWVPLNTDAVFECHVYTEGDEKARTAALRAAVRDGDESEIARTGGSRARDV